MNIARTREIVKTHGIAAGIQDLFYRGANRVTDLTILNAIAITADTVDRSFLDPSDDRWKFFDREELISQALAHGAAIDLEPAFVASACDRGDRCYGMTEGGVLASYGWYSELPTDVNDDLVLYFDTAYSYMYKGFTVPAMRGKRLHGIGMARALVELSAQGKKGLVSYVASTNFASLRSCYRLGYFDVGHLFAAKLGSRYVTHATKGCHAYGLRVGAKAS